MAANRLPQELVELVIEQGQIPGDKPCLASLSLVSRPWSFASSRHLFRKLRLRPQLENGSSPHDWYETFLLALQASERLREHVRELTFISERSDGQPKCSTLVLQHILACLPQLKVFEMNHLDFCNPQKASDFARSLSPVDHSPRLEIVELKNVPGFSTYYGDVVESGPSDSFGLAEFLNVFDAITELRLDNGALPFMYPITWHLLEATPKPLSRETVLHVERVHLAGQQSARALGVLQHMIDMRKLKELSLQLSPAVLQLADEFLGHAANLQHIHVSLRRDLTVSLGTFYIFKG